jgi:hypothetical protein
MCKKAKSKKVVSFHAIRVCRETEIASPILGIDAGWNGVVNCKLRPFYTRQKSRLPLNRKTFGIQSQDGLGRVEKKNIFFPEFKPMAVQPVV